MERISQLLFESQTHYFCKKICKYEHASYLHIAELGSLRSFIRFGFLLNTLPKLIITIHGTELSRFTCNPIEKLLFKRLLKRAELVHVLSAYNEKKLISLFPQLKEKTFRMGGAPARRLLPPQDYIKKRRTTSKIGILCVGRIHPRKGQDQLLKALKELPFKTQEKVEVTFVGSYTKKRYLKVLEKLTKGFLGKVSFTGEVNELELRKYFQKADIFSLTSTYQKKSVEGFGFVYLEASSYGLPILATRTGGVEDAVINGKTGLLAEPGKIIELSRFLLDLINNQQLRDKLGYEGKRWAKNFTWDKVARGLYSLD